MICELGLGLGVEQVVLDTEHVHALAAQDPAPDHALRIGLRGLVEDGGCGRTPVDEQHVVVLVAQPDAPDVAGLVAHLVAQVEPAEDEPLVGGVEGGHPPRSLEDHRVTLDQAALVADATTLEPFTRQLLGRQRRLLELGVDGVDVLLLARDLARGHVIVQRRCPPSKRSCRAGCAVLANHQVYRAIPVVTRRPRDQANVAGSGEVVHELPELGQVAALDHRDQPAVLAGCRVAGVPVAGVLGVEPPAVPGARARGPSRPAGRGRCGWSGRRRAPAGWSWG